MSTAILALEDVTVAYHGDITILNRINVQAREGKVTGVIGPNGAGKSTVLKTLFGFLPPRTGRITLRGKDISAQPSHERANHGVAFVPQHRSLFGELSVHDNLLLGCFLVTAAMAVVFNLITDFVYTLVDPRIEMQ